MARLREQILQESIPAPELARKLRVSRQRLSQMREERKLVALRVPGHRERLYPLWQFGIQGQIVYGGMPALLRAAEEARLDPLALHLLMTNPAAGHTATPAALLRKGRDAYVLGIVRAGAEQGA